MAEIYGTVLEKWSEKTIGKAMVKVEETGEAVLSGADGRYSLNSVERGHVHLNCTAERHTPDIVELDVDEGQTSIRVVFVLKPIMRAL